MSALQKKWKKKTTEVSIGVIRLKSKLHPEEVDNKRETIIIYKLENYTGVKAVLEAGRRVSISREGSSYNHN